MPRSTDNCTSVTLECPVDETIYGYYPNLGANAFFAAIFGIFLIINILLPFKYKSWTFASIIFFGIIGEVVGYVGRIIMHNNPWDDTGFQMQIVCLIIAPSFFAAALYLTLKDMVRAIGPQYSPIKPIWYPWIFISCDLFSLVLQGAGGGIAASADSDSSAAAGGHIMLAGIVFQVATFTFLYVLLAMFIRNLRNNKHTMTYSQLTYLRSRNFKVFAWGMFIASVAIWIRCIFRIAELAGGWKNVIMRDEISFYILDGAMCVIAIGAMTFSYPGIWFKPSLGEASVQEKTVSDSESSRVVGQETV